jgi:hypothetical protein
MTQDGCAGCKRVREHVASLLPFKVLESVAGKLLRIGGVAMAAGMSRKKPLKSSYNPLARDQELIEEEKQYS